MRCASTPSSTCSILRTSGEPPFCGNTNVETIRAILDWPLEFKGSAWDNISEGAKDCIRSMIERDPEQRPEARDVLEHKCVMPSHVQEGQSCDGTCRWLQDAGIAPRQPLHNAILKKMEKFSQCNKLKRIALKLIAEMLPEKETEGLRTIFRKMDRDNDGWINLHELKSAMRDRGSVVLLHTNLPPLDVSLCIRLANTSSIMLSKTQIWNNVAPSAMRNLLLPIFKSATFPLHD